MLYIWLELHGLDGSCGCKRFTANRFVSNRSGWLHAGRGGPKHCIACAPAPAPAAVAVAGVADGVGAVLQLRPALHELLLPLDPILQLRDSRPQRQVLAHLPVLLRGELLLVALQQQQTLPRRLEGELPQPDLRGPVALDLQHLLVGDGLEPQVLAAEGVVPLGQLQRRREVRAERKGNNITQGVKYKQPNKSILTRNHMYFQNHPYVCMCVCILCEQS